MISFGCCKRYGGELRVFEWIEIPEGRRFPDERWRWQEFESCKSVRETRARCRWRRRPSPPRACWTRVSGCRCQSPTPRRFEKKTLITNGQNENIFLLKNANTDTHGPFRLAFQKIDDILIDPVWGWGRKKHPSDEMETAGTLPFPRLFLALLFLNNSSERDARRRREIPLTRFPEAEKNKWNFSVERIRGRQWETLDGFASEYFRGSHNQFPQQLVPHTHWLGIFHATNFTPFLPKTLRQAHNFSASKLPPFLSNFHQLLGFSS